MSKYNVGDVFRSTSDKRTITKVHLGTSTYDVSFLFCDATTAMFADLPESELTSWINVGIIYVPIQHSKVNTMSKYKVGDTFMKPNEYIYVMNVQSTSNATLHEYELEMLTSGTSVPQYHRNVQEFRLDNWIAIDGFKYTPAVQITRIYKVGDVLEHPSGGFLKYEIMSVRFKFSGSPDYEVISNGMSANIGQFVEQAVLDDLVDRLGYVVSVKPTVLSSGAATIIRGMQNNAYVDAGAGMIARRTGYTSGVPVINDICTCEIRDLMMHGCKCGHLARRRA